MNDTVFRLSQLAELVGGEASAYGELPITGVRPFEDAHQGDITLALDAAYLGRLHETAASAVIIPRGAVTPSGKALLEVENPKAAFARIIHLFHSKPFRAEGISPLAHVGKDCTISGEVTIHPFVSVADRVEIGPRVVLFPGVYVGEGCRIGADCTFYANVTLYPAVSVGNRVTLHSGTVVGSDGFGYVFDRDQQVKVPQLGTVVIEDDVEVGANSCVDRATFGTTRICRGVKIDNHVHIAHNCTIGRNTVIVGQVGVSGSVEIGANCVFAGHAGVYDHVRIGDGARILPKSGVSKDVGAGAVVSGHPARDHRGQQRIEAVVRRLPEIYELFKELKRKREGGE